VSSRKGRSGRKPMPVAEHVLRGTYRPERHGPLPENVFAMSPPAPPPQAGIDEGWRPTAGRPARVGMEGKRARVQALLRRLVRGRLTFASQADGTYQFTGKGTVEPVLAGVIPNVASPKGMPGSRANPYLMAGAVYRAA
jgi:hypothetical protein